MDCTLVNMHHTTLNKLPVTIFHNPSLKPFHLNPYTTTIYEKSIPRRRGIDFP